MLRVTRVSFFSWTWTWTLALALGWQRTAVIASMPFQVVCFGGEKPEISALSL